MNKITFAGTTENYAGERVNKCFEIIVAETDGEIIAANGKTAYSAGEVIVIPPLVRFTLMSPNVSDRHILLEQALLPFKEIITVKDDGAGAIAHTARQAEQYINSDLPKKEIILSALGELIVAYITAFAEKNEFSPVVAMVRADISANLTNGVYSLEDALRKLPLNYDYVRKLFKKEVGATPHEYLVKLRMELAASFLTSGLSNRFSNYSVSQIAEACGYAEPLYFSRVFKKYYGVAPSEFAKQ